MVSNDPAADDYPLDPVARWPAADIAASWQRELPGVRTESIEIITPLWRIAKVLADDRRRTLAALGIDSVHPRPAQRDPAFRAARTSSPPARSPAGR